MAPTKPASGRVLKSPVFAQPEPTADPTIFKIKHPSDDAAYKIIDKLNSEHKIQPLPFPAPRGKGTEPQLTLLEVFGSNQKAIDTIESNGQIVFHATGDCGSTRGPKTQNEVTDKMIADFDETDPREVPQFALLLGDIVYNFGETEYYYDQFYEPYRNYQAPMLAAAGNHDGMISPLAHATSLAAYLRNFCADPAHGFTVTPEAGGLSRTAQIQPGVFFTFDAPFVRVLVFYSNTLEDPGVIANADHRQFAARLSQSRTDPREDREIHGRACSSPIIIRLTRWAVSIRRASRCASRWSGLRSGRRMAACGAGRPRAQLSALHAARAPTARRFPTSSAAMAVTMCRS